MLLFLGVVVIGSYVYCGIVVIKWIWKNIGLLFVLIVILLLVFTCGGSGGSGGGGSSGGSNRYLKEPLCEEFVVSLMSALHGCLDLP